MTRKKNQRTRDLSQKVPNTACTGQVRAFAHTFGEAAPRGGFGVWWFCPPIPALAGNACRWPAPFRVIKNIHESSIGVHKNEI